QGCWRNRVKTGTSPYSCHGFVRFGGPDQKKGGNLPTPGHHPCGVSGDEHQAGHPRSGAFGKAHRSEGSSSHLELGSDLEVIFFGEGAIEHRFADRLTLPAVGK